MMVRNPIWQTKRLGDIAEFRNGINYTKDSFGIGIKVIGVSNFQDSSKPNYFELDQINPEGVVKSSDILQDGDIVFVRSNGNRHLIGRSLYIDKPPGPVTHSAFTIRLRFNDGNVLPKFYAYFFKTSMIRQVLTAYGGGTNISNLNQNILSNIEVPYPLLLHQNQIVSILSAYDDLIENNLRRMKIFEEMAQNLYREWFVNFRFPGHEQTCFVDSHLGRIPEEWEIKSLDDLLIFKNDGTTAGEHLRNLAYLPIDCIPRKSLAITEVKAWEEAKSSLHLFEEGDILFGAMRPYFHKVVQAPFKGVTRKTCFVFISRRAEYRAYSLFTLFQEDTVAYASQQSKGATIPYAVWPNSMAKMKVIIPPLKYAKMFEALVRPAISRIGLFYKHNKNLRATRDLLLPKLISGEVDVSELDINVSEEEAV